MNVSSAQLDQTEFFAPLHPTLDWMYIKKDDVNASRLGLKIRVRRPFSMLSVDAAFARQHDEQLLPRLEA
jgi:hypothetical protein